MTHPALTTVAVPKREAGRATVALLLSLLADENGTTFRQRELPTQLIVRATTGVAPPHLTRPVSGHFTKGTPA